MTTTTSDDQLWTITEAAEFLQVTERWLKNSGRVHGVPRVKIGGLVRYIPAELRRWASQQTG